MPRNERSVHFAVTKAPLWPFQHARQLSRIRCVPHFDMHLFGVRPHTHTSARARTCTSLPCLSEMRDLHNISAHIKPQCTAHTADNRSCSRTKREREREWEREKSESAQYKENTSQPTIESSKNSTNIIMHARHDDDDDDSDNNPNSRRLRIHTAASSHNHPVYLSAMCSLTLSHESPTPDDSSSRRSSSSSPESSRLIWQLVSSTALPLSPTSTQSAVRMRAERCDVPPGDSAESAEPLDE